MVGAGAGVWQTAVVPGAELMDRCCVTGGDAELLTEHFLLQSLGTSLPRGGTGASFHGSTVPLPAGGDREMLLGRSSSNNGCWEGDRGLGQRAQVHPCPMGCKSQIGYLLWWSDSHFSSNSSRNEGVTGCEQRVWETRRRQTRLSLMALWTRFWFCLFTCSWQAFLAPSLLFTEQYQKYLWYIPFPLDRLFWVCWCI